MGAAITVSGGAAEGILRTGGSLGAGADVATAVLAGGCGEAGIQYCTSAARAPARSNSTEMRRMAGPLSTR